MGRLNQWIQRRKKFPPEGHVVSGRLAEYRLFKLARAVSGDSLVLEGIRIPDPEEGGRREIDMIVATKDSLLFVEQKHWSGSFTIQENGKFLQKRKNGSYLEHKDIIAWTARKGKILCDLHKERTGEVCPPSKTILVFSNQNLEWESLPNNSGAEAYDEIGFVNMLEGLERLPPSENLRETLQGFGTWDTIHLNGGKTLHGDIIDYPFERSDCEVKNSGLLGLLLGPKSTISNGELVNDLSGPLVSVVGEKGSRTIPFAHISKIEFSNPKAEWG
ncbi:MAG: nuclease-related domain-containing protein [Candidatus Poseidoniaceae archaeon]|nr:nuclease-related domain-containing protein [Candidatus Poseidoniaceae archaeon]